MLYTTYIEVRRLNTSFNASNMRRRVSAEWGLAEKDLMLVTRTVQEPGLGPVQQGIFMNRPDSYPTRVGQNVSIGALPILGACIGAAPPPPFTIPPPLPPSPWDEVPDATATAFFTVTAWLTFLAKREIYVVRAKQVVHTLRHLATDLL